MSIETGYDDGNNFNMFKKEPLYINPSGKYAGRSVFPNTNPGNQYHSALYNNINYNQIPQNFWGRKTLNPQDNYENQYKHPPHYSLEKTGIPILRSEPFPKIFNTRCL